MATPPEISDENTAIEELIRSTQGPVPAPGRPEVSLRPRAITTMPLPMEPLRRRPRATPPVPTKTTVRALLPDPRVTLLWERDSTPVLPPYRPAPNVGDPAEADATVPVEQFDFTELVDRHKVYLDPSPAKPSPWRFLPPLALTVLAAVFVIGFLMFDAETREPRTTAPPPKTVIAATPATSAPEVPAAAAPLALAHEPTATPKVPAFMPPPSEEPSRPMESSIVAEPPPKPRTSVYVTSNKPAQIFVDGKSASATAPKKLYLTPGPHKITLWDTASGKTETFKLVLPAGKDTPLDKRF